MTCTWDEAISSQPTSSQPVRDTRNQISDDCTIAIWEDISNKNIICWDENKNNLTNGDETKVDEDNIEEAVKQKEKTNIGEENIVESVAEVKQYTRAMPDIEFAPSPVLTS